MDANRKTAASVIAGWTAAAQVCATLDSHKYIFLIVFIVPRARNGTTIPEASNKSRPGPKIGLPEGGPRS